jgi:pilus assembly protein FimV
MPHTKTALLLMIAFALPGAAQALGLGEIHVHSALNEPLAAESDIVGATAEDLTGITASVANSETFLRLGVDRPAFLTTAAFKITRDSKGQPVLTIRSSYAFTEPLVSMLIDLRWHGGELIRQYTLLLDPLGFPSATRVAEALPTDSAPGALSAAALPAAPELVSETSKPASQATPNTEQTSTAVGEPVPPETVKVGARATLHGIALRVGSRGDAGLERMMIAIFRANPRAFEGNINRLRVGAVLTIPSASEVSATSVADANHEVQVQMETWHASSKFVGPAKPVALAAAAPAPDNTSEASDDATLDRRVQILEKGLNELLGALDREQDKLADIQARVALADKTSAATIVPPVAKSGHAIGASIAASLALATGAFGVIYAWRRRRMLNAKVSPADPKTQDAGAAQVAAEAPAQDEVTPGAPARDELQRDAHIEARPHAKDEERQSGADASAGDRKILGVTALDGSDVDSLDTSHTSEASGGGLEDTVNLDTVETAKLPSATMKICVHDTNAETMPLESARTMGMPEPSTPEHSAQDDVMSADKANADTAKVEYRLVDVDGTVHEIQMPSILGERGQVKERRTSLVDVLKIAVEREPDRRDLRMKLLETYYAAIVTSRQGFLEVVQNLARERDNMPDGEWDKIAGMGREIAANNDLFAPDTAQAGDKDLGNCA